MTTYVTAFYPVRSDIDMVSYWEDFRFLAESGVTILLFIDPETVVETLPPTVYVIRTRLPAFNIGDQEIILPHLRNRQKDTREFLWLMLQKLYFVTEAISYSDSPHLAWIDFRLFHIVKDRSRVGEQLRRIASTPLSSHRILAPGCWAPSSERDLFNEICWRYCGGLLIGPRDCFPEAYARQMELVRQFLPRLTWEVNYWAMMDKYFEWYAADHNDSMILNVPVSSTTNASLEV